MPATTGALAPVVVAAPAPGARRPLLTFRRAAQRPPQAVPTTRWRCRAGASAAAHGAPSSSAAARRRRGVKEYVEAAREMARRKDGGPPRWFAPLECGGGRVPGAPTLLYLPGTVPPFSFPW
ncbi:hypothetical protein BDA96_02G272600 [Sorghum bicolor]|uniref:Uncharacterized protein n=1 Tax=Sorghum bicolor TaxID=4558 RepID=A0A921UV02_SORBI|nr:hypothetical protein BDA96_02G272600 [Sorghum bicolor]